MYMLQHVYGSYQMCDFAKLHNTTWGFLGSMLKSTASIHIKNVTIKNITFQSDYTKHHIVFCYINVFKDDVSTWAYLWSFLAESMC